MGPTSIGRVLMPGQTSSLRQQSPRRVDVPITAAAGFVLLAVGVTVPALRFDNLFGDETFSVLSGIWGFVTSGNILLAVLLFGFSVLFPAVKLGAILALWFWPMRSANRREVVGWLELLGKWSLLDAFVIAVIVGAVQLGMLSEAVACPGVYLYLGAILLSLIATLLLRPLVRIDAGESPRAMRRKGLVLTVPAAVLYGAGLSLPLLDVEKGWFWSNRFSLLEAIGELFTAGDWGLAAAMLAFVVVLPTVRFLLMIVLRLLRSEDSPYTRALGVIDRLSMGEVFVVALLVVFTKLGSLATPIPLAGMWLLIASAAITAVDSILLHRRFRR